MTLRHTDTGYEAYDHDTQLTSVFNVKEQGGKSYRMNRLMNPDGLGIEFNFPMVNFPASLMRRPSDKGGNRIAGLYHPFVP